MPWVTWSPLILPSERKLQKLSLNTSCMTRLSRWEISLRYDWPRFGRKEPFMSMATSILDSSICEATSWEHPQYDNACSCRAVLVFRKCVIVLGESLVVSGFRVIHTNVSLPLVLKMACLNIRDSTLLFSQPSSASTFFDEVSFGIPPKQNSKPSQKALEHYL